MYLLIDNYDSFTHNLVHIFGECGRVVTVERNDQRTAEQIIFDKPRAIVISPGPGYPSTAGICLDLVKFSAERNIPIFGVCLGHQVIGETFGAEIIQNSEIVHGKTSIIGHCGSGIFKDCEKSFSVTRYHSLVINKQTIPNSLNITAWTDDGTIMGVRHKTKKIFGVQFHPESIASQEGKKIIRNFIEIVETV